MDPQLFQGAIKKVLVQFRSIPQGELRLRLDRKHGEKFVQLGHWRIVFLVKKFIRFTIDEGMEQDRA